MPPAGVFVGSGQVWGTEVRWSAGAHPGASFMLPRPAGPRGATGTKASRVTRRALACLSHHRHPPAVSFPSTSWEMAFPSASWPFHWPLGEPFSCPTSALHPHPPNTSTLLRLLQILAALRSGGWATASAVKKPDTKVPRGGVWGRGPYTPQPSGSLCTLRSSTCGMFEGALGHLSRVALRVRCLRTPSSHPSPSRFTLAGGCGRPFADFLLWISWIPSPF
ncbi:hypothetical protein mRhiFer1_009144 [Rhinolophus ferrumequinum]|uniref:Uncharacterized protein n=1 Tax=Rhinolophus ferrumequinum TaxID=59479 RepID=A0A7J7SJ16_RHIFE|nr:hypothetical protein mRhiFer1_009144 [Rhinolophus ferrumequinum]